MQRLARFVVRWTIMIVGSYTLGIYTGCFTMIMGVWLGYGRAVSMLASVYLALLTMAVAAVLVSCLIDEWEKRSPILTAERILHWWNAWKRLLRDPLRRERLLG